MMLLFESFVNSERCKTYINDMKDWYTFESFVNSERCKTLFYLFLFCTRLRALLIQKDVKLIQRHRSQWMGLRALLIQKDVKQT